MDEYCKRIIDFATDVGNMCFLNLNGKLSVRRKIVLSMLTLMRLSEKEKVKTIDGLQKWLNEN